MKIEEGVKITYEFNNENIIAEEMDNIKQIRDLK
jgi:hypothetical protein